MIPALPGSSGKDGQAMSMQLNKDSEAFLTRTRERTKETTLRERERRGVLTEDEDGGESQVFKRTFEMRVEGRPPSKGTGESTSKM